MKYSQIIVVPAYKPSDRIIDFVKALQEHFDNIVVIDDGGCEAYATIFDELEELGAKVLTHAVNMGKGRALKTAFNYCLHALKNGEITSNIAAKYPGVITVDADGQHRVEDIVKVAEAMDANPDNVVLGCRDFSTGNVPFKSYYGNNISKVVYKLLAGINVSDTQTGLRGIPFSLLGALCTCDGERYEYETNMFLIMKELNYAVTEVSIETIYEDNNSGSHFNPVKDSIKIYSVILKYSLSSLVSAFVDYIVFILVMSFNVTGGLIWDNKILFATYMARAISCIFNFTINKKMVFKGKGNSTVQFLKYLVLVVISGTVSGWSVTKLSSIATGVNPVFIKIPVEIVLYFFNYVIQRTIIFNEKKK